MLKLGRPPEKERSDTFLEVARFLRGKCDKQITIQNLIQHMEEILAHSEHGTYRYSHMQQKLKEHFGNKIIQTEINGKPNILILEVRPKKCCMTFIINVNVIQRKTKSG